MPRTDAIITVQRNWPRVMAGEAMKRGRHGRCSTFLNVRSLICAEPSSVCTVWYANCFPLGCQVGKPEKRRVEKADVIARQDERALVRQPLGVVDSATMIETEIDSV